MNTLKKFLKVFSNKPTTDFFFQKIVHDFCFDNIRELLYQEEFKFKLNVAFKGAKMIYQNDFSSTCYQQINQLYFNVLNQINKQIKIQLHPISKHYFERCYAILYTGRHAAVRPHRDAHPPSEFRTTIVLDLYKPPHFVIFNENNDKIHADEQVNDLYVFNGSANRHALITSEQQTSNSKRLVLIFTYTTIKNDSREANSICMCSKLYGSSTIQGNK